MYMHNIYMYVYMYITYVEINSHIRKQSSLTKDFNLEAFSTSPGRDHGGPEPLEGLGWRGHASGLFRALRRSFQTSADLNTDLQFIVGLLLSGDKRAPHL